MQHVPHFGLIAPKGQHNVYRENDIISVLDYLTQPILPRRTINKMHKDTGIPQQVLSSWRQNRLLHGNSSWIPYTCGHEENEFCV